MSNVGFATLSIIPSFKGLQTEMRKAVEDATRGLNPTIKPTVNNDDVRGGTAETERLFKGSLGRVEAEGHGMFSRLLKGAGGFTAGLGKALGGLTLGAAGLAAGVAVAGKGLVDKASNAAEAQSKVTTVFGASADGVNDFAKQADKSLGISRTAALDAAGGFGNMFAQIGIGSDATADMSKGLLALSGDLSSFHNAASGDVLDSLSSAFRGEFDSVQKFIPTINAATVEQKALALTGKKVTAELTNQDKALATYQLLMGGAGNATGDFARTAGGFANQQRIMGAQWENLQTSLGEKFLPIAQRAMSWLGTTGLPIIEKVADAVSVFADLIATGDWGALKTKAGEALSGLWSTITSWISDNAGNMAAAGIGFLSSLWSAEAQALGALFDLLGEWLPKIGDWVINVAVPYVEAHWGEWWDAFTGWVADTWNFLQPKLADFLGKMASWIFGTLIPWAIQKGQEWGLALLQWFVREAIPWAVKHFVELLRAIGQWIEDSAIPWLLEKGGELGTALLDFLKSMPGRIREAAGGMWDGIVAAFKAALNILIGMWNGLQIPQLGPWTIEAFGKSLDIGPFGPFDLPDIPTFHQGGTVPGPVGQERLILALGGEHVSTIDETRRGGSGPDLGGIHIHSVASPSEVAALVEVKVMRRLKRAA